MAQWLGRLAMSKFCWARSVDLTIEHLLSRSKALNCQPQKVCSNGTAMAVRDVVSVILNLVGLAAKASV